jgi:hypothetical protein
MPTDGYRRSPATVAMFLSGLQFPATRDDVMLCAEDEYTPQEILDILEQIPDRNYSNMADVVSAISVPQTLMHQD